MNVPKNMSRSRRAGYSLVEVTLALLVVAIGLTATFALFPEGLRATRAAVDDTETAMFAEYVFTSMDLAAGFEGGGWGITHTDRFRSAAFSDRHIAQAELDTGTGRVFYWIPEDYDLGDGNYDAAKDAGFWTAAFTYDLEIRDSTFKNSPGAAVTKYAVLRVWPGDFSGVAPSVEPRIFYREFLPLR
jgi:type II secretory pathway pseudopilin PulG